MRIVPNLFGLQLIGATVTLCLHQYSVSAQSITPASDGTGTQINNNGNRYDIEGGSLSNDSENLFHSFEKFGLENGETANFISNPDIRNILGRVTGGDASIIHGLIQITGGNSNLFLINPAGVIFGANASLNLPANFTVTTATGIQFGQNWFNAVGDNNYSTLIGTPSGYNFDISQPGVILNEANLTLSEGSNLTLLGGTVINTGELSTPGGQITIAAVEGENFVRISQEGQLLNLEITPLETSSQNYPITPLSLPELLTGGDNNYSANSVVISNGQVILQNSDTIIPEEAGTTIAAGIFDVSDNNTGGTVNIFSSNFTIIESDINTTGENLSGNVFINSDNKITINQLTAETENLEIIAAQDIDFNQLTTEGSLTAETKEGNINRIGDNSLITAQTVLFQTGETGSIGTVDNPVLLDFENLEAVAGSGGIFLENNSDLTIGNVSEEFTGISTTGGGDINLNVEGNLTVLEDISTAVYDEKNAGYITLNSSGNINITEGLLLSFSGEEVYNEYEYYDEYYDEYYYNYEYLNIGGNGGNVTLTAEGDITTGYIFSNSYGEGRGGDITLNSNTGEINTTNYYLYSYSSQGDGGDITLTAAGDITTGYIFSNSYGEGRGGDITLNSNTGEINTKDGSLDAVSFGEEGGNITLTSEGNITTGYIDSSSSTGTNGGDITLNSNTGKINTISGSLNATGYDGDGGNITLKAEGDITTSGISSSSYGIVENDIGGRGGNITLNSNTGEINTVGDVYSSLDSSSYFGDGGNISIEAFNRITVPNVNSSGDRNGGNINIISEVGDIDTDEINYSSSYGTPGNLNIQAYSGSIEWGEISSRNLTITSDGEDNPFTNNNPEASINSDANLISNQRNEVILDAHNDITLNQAIESDSISVLELRAGRNININADIDTSASNGDINLTANAGGANPEYRESGTGNIIMQPDTVLNAGAGDIRLLIGNFGEVENIGDITIANIQTTGNVSVDARGGNIISAANDSLITANSGSFQTKDTGTIGSEINPIHLNINTLEGTTGSGGAFLNSPNQGITITEFTTFNNGDISVTAQGNIIAEGTLSTSNAISSSAATSTTGNITLESIDGDINTTGGLLDSANVSDGDAGDITLTARENITTGNISSNSFYGQSGDIDLSSNTGEINTIGGLLNSSNSGGIAGNVTLTAPGNIITGDIKSNSFGADIGGDITLRSTNGSIDTTGGILESSTTNGTAGNVFITAQENIITGDIYSTGFKVEFTTSSLSADPVTADFESDENSTFESTNSEIEITNNSIQGNGGNITLESTNGEINTTGGFFRSLASGNGGNITLNALSHIRVGDLSSDSTDDGRGGDISINSQQGEITTSSLLSSSEEGTGGNISLDAAGHIETQSILSQGLQRGGDITINSDSQNSINILGDLQTFSEQGTAGNITLSAPGNITIQNVTSFGQTESGNLIINSEGSISTESVTTQADNGPSGNIIINGENIATGNVSSIGTDSAGIIEITATDGSVTTEDITSSSSEGDAGGIDIEATDNINTEDQTVESEEGDSTIENTAGNDINTDNQTAIASDGNSAIDNTAENNINTDNQTAETNNGDASVSNTAENNINTDNQTAETNNGNSAIDNTAENDINVNNQTARTQEGNASIENTAENDINVNNQTATTQQGNASINNTAGNDINVNSQTAITEEGTATIENNAGGEVNVGNQTATQDGNPGTIINQEGDSNPQTEIQESNYDTIINQESISNSDNYDSTNLSNNSTQTLVISEEESIYLSQQTGESDLLRVNRVNTVETDIQASSDTDGDNLSSDSDNINSLNLAAISPLSIASADAVTRIESSRNQEFADHFGEDFAETDLTTEDVRNVLDDITQKTGTRSAIVYVTLANNQLELVIFTSESQPLFYRVEVPREELLKVARKFHQEVANPRMSQRYLKPAQQLYDWLIRPIDAHLKQANIDTILFSLDRGLRGLPIAAIHDGEQFLIEKYSLSLIPSVSLINTNYSSLANTEVLAMGASEFTQLEPLPNVPIELEIITQRRWLGDSFLNQEFTRDNLMNQRQNNSYSIIHLATHSDFSRQNPDESYIQLWQDEQLKFNQLRTSLLSNSPLEMLVLSSCRTAVGDEKAEMGFAGLAVQAQVKTALASLWYVDDRGTLALMSEFYRHLDGSPIKAGALRKAQLAMIQGTVEEIETQLIANQSLDEITSSPVANSLSSLDLSHPYYWSAFTMIGSPW
ncbi:MAG: CHAT domain-containing protein [Microcoleaceae cyanobacterium]